MKSNRIPLLSLKKAFGNQSYWIVDEMHKKQLLDHPLVNGLFTIGRSFVIIANTYNWDLELITGDSLSLTGYTSEEIKDMSGEFVVNYMDPAHSEYMFSAIRAFMDYSNACDENERDRIFAVYFYSATRKSGEKLVIQHQSIPLIFDENKVPYIFCNIYSDITYLEPRNVPQAIMVNKVRDEIFHYNPLVKSLEKREEIFSEREKEIIRYLGMGYTSKQIASILHISIDTVRTHRKNILSKAGINNTASLVKYALMNGIY